MALRDLSQLFRHVLAHSVQSAADNVVASRTEEQQVTVSCSAGEHLRRGRLRLCGQAAQALSHQRTLPARKAVLNSLGRIQGDQTPWAQADARKHEARATGGYGLLVYVTLGLESRVGEPRAARHRDDPHNASARHCRGEHRERRVDHLRP